MGSKNKLKRFKENETFTNVIQPSREDVMAGFEYKGKWASFFGNNNPIVLELGCGKGEYTVGLAQINPDKNHIGIDIKGARFWRGAKTALEEKLNNAAFLRSQIELVDHLFAEGEVSEIWITFPDPQIKRKRSSKRLTHPNFLRKYNSFLIKNGIINLKTDSQFLHEYTLGVIESENHYLIDSTDDIYQDIQSRKNLDIKTYYEKMFLKKDIDITYIKFTLQY